MAKNKSGNALPILAIVFSSVSMILFLVQILFTASHYQIKHGFGLSGFSIMILSICVVTLISMFPAVFFIICASKYFGGNKNKFLSVSLIAVSVSSLLLALNRLISCRKNLNARDIKHIIPEIIIVALYLIIIVFCIVALVRLGRQKTFKPFAIIAASTGLLIIVLMICFNSANIIPNLSFDFNSLFKAGIKIMSDALYEFAFIFLYISLIFITLPYGRKQRIKVTIKSKH